jgi:hypothetical protein
MWTSKFCKGVGCHFNIFEADGTSNRCGKPAVMKVGEEIFDDDPFPHRHNLTAYICEKHAHLLLGSTGITITEKMRDQGGLGSDICPVCKTSRTISVKNGELRVSSCGCTTTRYDGG